MNDEIDITPKSINPSSAGRMGLRQTVFQETEWFHILQNPSRLTKEGVEAKIELWRESNNRHVQLKYETMLVQCKNFALSGKTKEGKTILSRNVKGDHNWVKEDKDERKAKSV